MMIPWPTHESSRNERREYADVAPPPPPKKKKKPGAKPLCCYDIAR